MANAGSVGEVNIPGYEISDVIESCLQKVTYIREPVLEDLINTDKETRALALEFVK